MPHYTFNTLNDMPPLGYQPELVPALEFARTDLTRQHALKRVDGTTSNVHKLGEASDYVARYEHVGSAPVGLALEHVPSFVGKLCQEFIHLEEAGITTVPHRYTVFEYDDRSGPKPALFLGSVAPRVPIVPLDLNNHRHFEAGLRTASSTLMYIKNRLKDPDPRAWGLRDVFFFEQYGMTGLGDDMVLLDTSPRATKVHSTAWIEPIDKWKRMIDELMSANQFALDSPARNQIMRLAKQGEGLHAQMLATKWPSRSIIELEDIPGAQG